MTASVLRCGKLFDGLSALPVPRCRGRLGVCAAAGTVWVTARFMRFPRSVAGPEERSLH